MCEGGAASAPAPLLGEAVAEQVAEVCESVWPEHGPWTSTEAPLRAATAAAERLARRLQAALRDEGLLEGAQVHLGLRKGAQVGLDNWGALVVASAEPADGAEGGDGAAFRALGDFAAIAEFLCRLCPGAEANARLVEEELRHSFQQECLCLAYRMHVWDARHAGVESFWRHFFCDSERPVSNEERLLALEQLAAFFGHPWHVMAKSRLPLSLKEAAASAPEFAPAVELRLLAVHEDLLRVFPSPEEWRALWRERCPGAAQCLQAAAAASLLGPPAEEMVLVPVHPLNEPRVRELYAQEFGAKRMLFLSGDGAAIASTPTLSLRTLSPQDVSLNGLRLKLPVPIQATSLPRYVSPVEVLGSTLVGRALRGLELPPELAWQAEDHAVHLRFQGGGANSPEGPYTYEEARFCSAIVRVSPSTAVRDGCNLVPLAALFARPRGESAPSMWHDFWDHHGVADGFGWFQDYVAVVLRAFLGAFVRYGVAMEAHQQNTLLEVDERGVLQRVVYQELGGGIFWDRERLALLPVDFSGEVYARDDVLEPFDKCVACVRHAVLRSHLVPLMEEVVLFFGLRREDLRRHLEGVIADFPGGVSQSTGDRLSAERFADYGAATVRGLLGPGKRKALLRMRLLQTKSEVYVETGPELGGPSR